MSIRRITFSIFSASLTFSISVTFAWFYFLPKQVFTPQIKQALPLKGNPFEFNDLSASKLLEIHKAKTSPLKERKFPDVWDTKETVAGKIEIIETDFLEWKIVLDGKQILTNEDLPPHIDAKVTGRFSPYKEVIMFSQSSGTCCEFGRFWFLGLNSDGSYCFSKSIGNGFADVPKISIGKNYVKVKVLGGRENHGEFYLPGGVWIFQHGRVRKVK